MKMKEGGREGKGEEREVKKRKRKKEKRRRQEDKKRGGRRRDGSEGPSSFTSQWFDSRQPRHQT